MICAAPNDTTIVAFPEDDAGDVLTNSICDRGTPVLFDRACASASNVVLPLTTICSTVGALVVAGAMLVRGGELVVTTAAVDGPAFSPEGACVVGSSAVAFPAAGVAVVLRSPDPDPAALVIGGRVVSPLAAVVDGILDGMTEAKGAGGLGEALGRLEVDISDGETLVGTEVAAERAAVVAGTAVGVAGAAVDGIELATVGAEVGADVVVGVAVLGTKVVGTAVAGTAVVGTDVEGTLVAGAAVAGDGVAPDISGKHSEPVPPAEQAEHDATPPVSVHCALELVSGMKQSSKMLHARQSPGDSVANVSGMPLPLASITVPFSRLQR